jgi:hypothetical protein
MTGKSVWAWAESVLRPVLVSVLTAGILFLLASIFKPKIYELFAPPMRVKAYPLICYAEPVATGEEGTRQVEFYVVNLHGDEYTRDELNQLLRTLAPDERPLSADVRLWMKGNEGVIDSVVFDSAFNAGKGSVEVELGDDTRSVELRFERIAQRAIIRVDLYFSGLLDLGVTIRRTAKVMVPFDYERLQDGCLEF